MPDQKEARWTGKLDVIEYLVDRLNERLRQAYDAEADANWRRSGLIEPLRRALVGAKPHAFSVTATIGGLTEDAVASMPDEDLLSLALEPSETVARNAQTVASGKRTDLKFDAVKLAHEARWTADRLKAVLAESADPFGDVLDEIEAAFPSGDLKKPSP